MADTTHEPPSPTTDRGPESPTATHLFQPDDGPRTALQTGEQLALAAALSAGQQTVPG